MAAFGAPPYFAQAVLAAASIKAQHPNLPIAIVSDQPGHPLLQPGWFDHKLPMDLSGAPALPHGFAAPLLGRVSALALSPFQKTLSFDVDARLRAPRLDALFALLDQVEIAMAPCFPDTSRERQMFGRPIYNNGIILYRKTERMLTFLRRFEDTFRRHLAAATAAMPDVAAVAHIPGGADRQRLLCSDQIALAQFFSPERNDTGAIFAVLGDHWNWRGGDATRRPAEPIVIDHHPSLRENTWPQLADLAFRLLAAGDGKRAAPLYGQVLAALQPDLFDASRETLMAQLQHAPETAAAADRIAGLAPAPPNLESLLRIAALHAVPLRQADRAARILAKVAPAQPGR